MMFTEWTSEAVPCGVQHTSEYEAVTFRIDASIFVPEEPEKEVDLTITLDRDFTEDEDGDTLSRTGATYYTKASSLEWARTVAEVVATRLSAFVTSMQEELAK